MHLFYLQENVRVTIYNSSGRNIPEGLNIQQHRRQNYRPRTALYFLYYFRYNMTCDSNSNYNLFVSVQPDELPYSVGMTK
jgi:hypothetical protein